MKNKGKLKGNIITAIICGVVCLAAVSLIITDIFVPVKYISAYLVTENKNSYGQLRVSFVDVGMGDCTIIEFPDGKTLLIDGGDGSYPSNIKVLTALNKRGIDNIDYLICTSLSKQRCGGLSEVLAYKTVSEVFAPYFPYGYYNDAYRNFSEALESKSIQTNICEYGVGVFNDEEGYLFCLLSPSEHLLEGGESQTLLLNPTADNVKNASAVVYIECCGISFLLLGDGGEEMQSKLISNLTVGYEINGRKIDVANCTVLKLPDHGSSNAAGGILYEFLHPEAAIISVGANNYGYPSVQAISNAQKATGGNVCRTDEDGTVTVIASGGAYEIQKEKK